MAKENQTNAEALSGADRRNRILKILQNNKVPVSASSLAKRFEVSRQIIVQDIALLRAEGRNIYSTSKGYQIHGDQKISRVFKVWHMPEQVKDELYLIVDLGGKVEDVFVYHKVYGIVTGELSIKSRYDVDKYMETIESGESTYLSNITGGYHYHTVSADSTEILDLIQEKLKEHGFLAKLTDYEPVDFWN